MHASQNPFTGSLAKEYEIISRILELFPKSCSLINFHPDGIDTAGYVKLRWKYHRDRMLYIRWNGLSVDIRQRIASKKEEREIILPIIWGHGRAIAFDGNGEAKIPEQLSHTFWCEANQIDRT